jgi:hypothetical protein
LLLRWHPQRLLHLQRWSNFCSVQNRKFKLCNHHWPIYSQVSNLDDIFVQSASTWVHIIYHKLYFCIVFLLKIYLISKASLSPCHIYQLPSMRLSHYWRQQAEKLWLVYSNMDDLLYSRFGFLEEVWFRVTHPRICVRNA